jgi:hypothetical protein
MKTLYGETDCPYHLTYWCERGKNQNLYNKLIKLIPFQGEVENPEKNKKLEKLRKASNLYHDLYNNGGWNYSGSDFSMVFGFSVKRKFNSSLKSEFEQIVAKIEEKMDRIIEDAAKEQLITLPF